jgi:hypothetical protein
MISNEQGESRIFEFVENHATLIKKILFKKEKCLLQETKTINT